MRKLLMVRISGVLAIGSALLVSSCGGGGGDSGTPLVPPTSKLIMSPNIPRVKMDLGAVEDITKISGGQLPYYPLASGGAIPIILSDGSLVLRAVSTTLLPSSSGTTPSCDDASSSSSDATVSVEDSSYAQTTVSFKLCVNPSPSTPAAPGLQTTLGTATSGVDITLASGASEDFTVHGGTGPYTVVSSDPSVAEVSITNNADNTAAVAVTGGTASGTNLITLTDAKGVQLLLIVQNTAAAATTPEEPTPPASE